MHGPVVIYSVIAMNSGSTPLYISKNSSAVGLSRLNICMAEISNPSSKILSIICPAWPAAIMCGLITQHVLLLRRAVVGISLKKMSISAVLPAAFADP